LVFVVLASACGPKDAYFPSGGSPSDDDTGTAVSAGDCGDEWTSNGEVAFQPQSCLIWGPRSPDKMSWFEAATPDDGEAGGCGDECPGEDDGWCPTMSGLSGLRDWRMATSAELMAASKTDPPMADVEGRLWSRTTSDVDDGNAWTLDLNRGGARMSQPKTATNYARCVHDPD
jgi:hypothetical protein